MGKSVPKLNNMRNGRNPNVKFKVFGVKKRKGHGTIKTVAIRSNFH